MWLCRKLVVVILIFKGVFMLWVIFVINLFNDVICFDLSSWFWVSFRCFIDFVSFWFFFLSIFLMYCWFLFFWWSFCWLVISLFFWCLRFSMIWLSEVVFFVIFCLRRRFWLFSFLLIWVSFFWVFCSFCWEIIKLFMIWL